LIASLDGFNVFNEDIVLEKVDRQSASTANTIEEMIAPRVFRLGLRLTF